jgi:hypothetical protein
MQAFKRMESRNGTPIPAVSVSGACLPFSPDSIVLENRLVKGHEYPDFVAAGKSLRDARQRAAALIITSPGKL